MKGIHFMMAFTLGALLVGHHVPEWQGSSLAVALVPWVLWLFGIIKPTHGFEGVK